MNQGMLHWLGSGTGTIPELVWSYNTEASLVSLTVARETGEVVAADTLGGVYLLDRLGRIKLVSRGFGGLHAFCFSDVGNGGLAILGKSTICRFTSKLKVQWKTQLHATALSVAIDPYGHNFAVGLADSSNQIYSRRKKLLAEYSSIRPLSFLNFVVSKRRLIGAAEQGSFCCFDFRGRELWQDNPWTHVGEMSITGDGDLIALASLNLGIQCYDGRGNKKSSLYVEGTVEHISVSYQGTRVAVSTVEQQLYWLDQEGEILWAANVPTPVKSLQTLPWGDGLVVGLEDGTLCCLKWNEVPLKPPSE